VTHNDDGTATIACEDGTSVTVEDGMDGSSCTITDNDDGTATLSCDDGTSVDYDIAECGNGVVESGEECDGTMGCTMNCEAASFAGTTTVEWAPVIPPDSSIG
jgi:hypothetical protein